MAKNILAFVDFSSITEKVVEKAGELAAFYHGKCWIVHIASPDPSFVGYDVGPQHERDNRAAVLNDEHKQLQEIKEKLQAEGIECEALLIQGQLPQAVMEETEKLHADMIVVGSHGRSQLYELLVGSVCEYLLRNSKVPVVVVPSNK